MATIKERIDNVTENVTDGKVEISSAITDKGVTTSSNATFSTMANNIRAIESGAKDRIQNEADSSYVYVKSDDTIEADCSDCNIHAANQIKNMYGEYRLPYMVKKVDSFSREEL